MLINLINGQPSSFLLSPYLGRKIACDLRNPVVMYPTLLGAQLYFPYLSAPNP